jgi:hypothetical protein
MITDREAIVRLSLLLCELAQEVAFQATCGKYKLPANARRLMREAVELKSRITDGHIVLPEEPESSAASGIRPPPPRLSDISDRAS